MTRFVVPIKDTLLETVSLLKPGRVLDVGCGGGSFTAQLAAYCEHVTAIDISAAAIDHCVRENPRPNVLFQRMDATKLSFPDASFEVALERASLHHLEHRQEALAEMVRVSSKYILLEEPIDDLRTDAKRRTHQAQRLFLEVQREAGYMHLEHLRVQELTAFFSRIGRPCECKITRSDQATGFDEFFEPFPFFAQRTSRPAYWMDRLAGFKASLPDTTLCENDTLLLVATKA